jgi:hypothetical protein
MIERVRINWCCVNTVLEDIDFGLVTHVALIPSIQATAETCLIGPHGSSIAATYISHEYPFYSQELVSLETRNIRLRNYSTQNETE